MNRTIAVTFVEPYWTVDGVSRTLEAYQRNLDPSNNLSVSPYESSTWGGAVSSGIPISETDTINLGFCFESTELTLFDNSPLSYRQYVEEFGDSPKSIIVSLGWARDTRDDILYPSRGMLQVAGVEVGTPVADLTYYKASYHHQYFYPISRTFSLLLEGEVGYADGYSGKELPFFKNFYAGGINSVRGYETASGALVLDTTQIEAAQDDGWTCWDVVGTAFLSIASVSYAGTTVTITLSATPTGRTVIEVGYAYRRRDGTQAAGTPAAPSHSPYWGNVKMVGPASTLFSGKTIDAWLCAHAEEVTA